MSYFIFLDFHLVWKKFIVNYIFRNFTVNNVLLKKRTKVPYEKPGSIVPETSPIVLSLSLLRFVEGNRVSTANHTASGTAGLL